MTSSIGTGIYFDNRIVELLSEDNANDLPIAVIRCDSLAAAGNQLLPLRKDLERCT